MGPLFSKPSSNLGLGLSSPQSHASPPLFQGQKLAKSRGARIKPNGLLVSKGLPSPSYLQANMSPLHSLEAKALSRSHTTYPQSTCLPSKPGSQSPTASLVPRDAQWQHMLNCHWPHHTTGPSTAFPFAPTSRHIYGAPRQSLP